MHAQIDLVVELYPKNLNLLAIEPFSRSGLCGKLFDHLISILQQQ